MGLAASLVPQTNNSTDNSTGNKPMILTDENFERITSEGMVFVDFWAEWCGPCKAIAPVIDQLAEEWSGKVKFGKLDVDANVATSQLKFQIQSIPTFYVFVNGKKMDELIGAARKEVFQDFIKKNYETYAGTNATA